MIELTDKIIDIADSVKENLVEILEEDAIIKTIDIIMDEYERNLNNLVDIHSQSAPEHYMDVFKARLMEYTFIKREDGVITLSVPDLDTFDFSHGLEKLKIILEGLAGNYVEISGKDYRTATGNALYNGTYIEEDKTYLFREEVVKNIAGLAERQFEHFPFSNSPPIDIFNNADKFVDKNMKEWIDKSIELSVN